MSNEKQDKRKAYDVVEKNFDFESDINSIIRTLEILRDRYCHKYDNLYFEASDACHDEYNLYGANKMWNLIGVRDETDEEAKERTAKEIQSQEYQRQILIDRAKKMGIRAEDLI